MTKEEKARAYDEALRKIRPLYEQAKKEDCPIWSTYEYVFHELADSEDERVRKELIGHLKECRNNTRSEVMIGTYAKWIAYLEKQKEQSITANDLDEEVHRFFDDCIVVHEEKLYGNISEKVIPVDCYELTARHFAKWGEQQKEQNLEDIEDNAVRKYMKLDKFALANMLAERDKTNAEVIEAFGSIEEQPAEKLFKEEYVKKFKALCDAYEIKLPNREYDIYHLCNDLAKLSIDSGEQKSAGWSKEDENVYESIQTILLAEARFVEERKWFGSIKARIKSACWDEKDEKMCDRLIGRLQFITLNTRTDTTSPNITFFDEIDWLKDLPERFNLPPKPEVECDNETEIQKAYGEGIEDSIHELSSQCENSSPQPHWKPSEE